MSTARPRRRALRPVGLVALSLLMTAGVLTACSNDGRTLRDPPNGGIYPDPNAPAEVPYPTLEEGLEGFVISSDLLEPGEPLPASLECGAETPELPRLSWTNVAADIMELAVVVTDLDAVGLERHWIVAGIDPTLTSIDGSNLPEGAIDAITDAGIPGWDPPCRVEGEVRNIRFAVHAMNQLSDLDPNGTVLESMSLIERLTLTETALVTPLE